MGLLPDVSADLKVPIPEAGLLVTAYALSVAFGSPFLAIATARMNRRGALLLLMGVFILGNLLCALAPSYSLLMAARIVCELCHGAFFGLGTVVAAALVPQEKRTQAIAMMFGGLALANVLGGSFRHGAGQCSRLATNVLGGRRHRLCGLLCPLCLAPPRCSHAAYTTDPGGAITWQHAGASRYGDQRPRFGESVWCAHVHNSDPGERDKALRRFRHTYAASVRGRADVGQSSRRAARRLEANAIPDWNPGPAGAALGPVYNDE